MASTFHRDRVASQGGFGGHAGHTNTLVHEGAERLHDGKNVKYSWPAKTDLTAQSEESDLLPLPYHVDCEPQVKAWQCAHDYRRSLLI